MKLLPLLAALPLLRAGVVSASSLMSVGYFNGSDDVAAGPDGDINKLGVRQITRLNYSFSLVYNNEEDETDDALKDASKLHQIWLSQEVQDDLLKIPQLRKQNPNLKALPSVGGWGACGFSGVTAAEETRAVFIQSTQEVTVRYGLDGTDLDRECPANGAWGLVESQPAGRANFTALPTDLRTTLGHKKLLTIVVGADAESPKSQADVKATAPSLDYINLTTYDMTYGTQYFNSNLCDSTQWLTVAAADKYSVDFVINDCFAADLEPSQMNPGIGFYGRVSKRAAEPGIDWSKPDAQKNPATLPYFESAQTELFKSLGIDLSKDTCMKYNDIVTKLINDPQRHFSQHWDGKARVPWLPAQSADGKRLFALSYKNPRSVVIKADYIKSKELAGAMFWEYGADDNNQLAKQLADLLGIRY